MLKKRISKKQYRLKEKTKLTIFKSINRNRDSISNSHIVAVRKTIREKQLR
jgi:hypothetical protein